MPAGYHLSLRRRSALFHFWVTTHLLTDSYVISHYQCSWPANYGHSSGRSIRRSRTFVSAEKSSN